MTRPGSRGPSREPDAYLPLRVLAGYGGLSVRTLRSYLTHATHPLPHYRIGGKIVVRRSEYDSWVSQFHIMSSPRLHEIVDDLMADLP
jgi:hypothetical protein